MAGLLIRVSAGVGTGPTRLAAFDAALQEAGVADFNLVRLSSVIPPGSTVATVRPDDQVRGGHGDVLYCVYADAYASIPGESAWAGVAWAERAGDGAGLFVEHSAATEDRLRHDLEATLTDLARRRRGPFEQVGSLTASAICDHRPVCALVIAAYLASPWVTPSS